MATKGVIIQPILAAPEQAPKPIPRMLVGYTSGVYTYPHMSAILINRREPYKNMVVDKRLVKNTENRLKRQRHTQTCGLKIRVGWKTIL